jgi:hypothetical protein
MSDCKRCQMLDQQVLILTQALYRARRRVQEMRRDEQIEETLLGIENAISIAGSARGDVDGDT